MPSARGPLTVVSTHEPEMVNDGTPPMAAATRVNDMKAPFLMTVKVLGRPILKPLLAFTAPEDRAMTVGAELTTR